MFISCYQSGHDDGRWRYADIMALTLKLNKWVDQTVLLSYFIQTISCDKLSVKI